MKSFSEKIFKIGINPYILLPENILIFLFKEAAKDKGPIPIRGTMNGQPFVQTLVKYSGHWRLYLNTPMRKAAKADVGDTPIFKIEFYQEKRIIQVHPKLKSSFEKNKSAKKIFDTLPPSRQKEIIRYISNLKTEESVNRNIEKAIKFLLGKERFVGRDAP